MSQTTAGFVAPPKVRYVPSAEERIFRWPIDMTLARFTPGSGFGPRQRRDAPPGEFEEHPALDIGAPLGTPVYAAAAGVVDIAVAEGDPDAEDGAGNYVKIRHLEDVESDGLMVTHYYHLQNEPLVQVGDLVTHTTQLGEVGQSGTAGGPHVCFRTIKVWPGKAIALNPRQVLREYGVSDVGSPRAADQMYRPQGERA
ncbi:M23 family metallopeptidase [Pseudoclavibacter helvolus]|uniref:Murein DD-endopeptidase MepM/ murein hydrolase activator NlpD n=1 Tax=Pseudoclavibacter helvolus TaxID=255205 RepID=A0A7W4UM30_9MICO|nr:M23 family metallopeptidase [Pseudoclavibacter helvolus]MBB2956961.1 murein DD-endopeptidase MepM/ murein hydrolase activator NlpD [Pseudoclavibacter helvolus]